MNYVLFKLGLKSVFICVIKKALFKLLQVYFDFNPWHASAPYECRPYKRDVVELANKVAPSCTIEIGCGLGEILARVDSFYRLGVDIEKEVINAAYFLYGKKCRFAEGSIDDVTKIAHIVDHPVDLLIMINWTHGIKWIDLSVSVMRLVERFNVDYILIDGIIPGNLGYPYYHGPDNFLLWGDFIETKLAADGVRMLYLIRTHNTISRLNF